MYTPEKIREFDDLSECFRQEVNTFITKVNTFITKVNTFITKFPTKGIRPKRGILFLSVSASSRTCIFRVVLTAPHNWQRYFQ